MTPRRRITVAPAADIFPSDNPSGNAFRLPEPLRSPRTPDSTPDRAPDPLELEAGDVSGLRRRSEAIRAGMERARARGVVIGRPRVPSTARARVLELAAPPDGWSLREIVAETGLGINTVRRILAE